MAKRGRPRLDITDEEREARSKAQHAKARKKVVNIAVHRDVLALTHKAQDKFEVAYDIRPTNTQILRLALKKYLEIK